VDSRFIRTAWNMCEGGDWCRLFALDLTHPAFDNVVGVYVIFYLLDEGPRAVVIHHGPIRDAITIDKESEAILAYEKTHGLYVTWAKVSLEQCEGAALYLNDKLSPEILYVAEGVFQVPIPPPFP
jgi:hypothetical protein